jgi:cytochrome c2
MTEAEIMKALECCIKSSHFGECFENGCPLVSEEGCKVGKETLYPHLLDLINRKNAEIEEYKKRFEMLDANERIAIGYADALKEQARKFAEMVKMGVEL